MYDIIIIGAGPAGLTASIYARRAGKRVSVLEAKTYGGQIINSMDIENYPTYEHITGFDFATNLYNQAKNIGVEIIFERVISINDKKEVITNKKKYQAKSIIIATGLDNKKLNLPNEDKLIGKGISYCATCDGAFYKGKDVAVVGGGNTALEEALYLTNLAHKVYIIHRRDQFRAEDYLQNQIIQKKNVVYLLNSKIENLIGNEKLEKIIVSDKDGNQKEITIEALFVAIGKKPNDAENIFIKKDELGYIIAQEDCHTNIEGIYVAGDVRTKEVRQLVTATSDGAIAALEAVKYLNNKETREI